MKITDYKVLAAVYGKDVEIAVQHNRLERQIKDYIASGWQPYGTLSVTRHEESVMFAQAMVLYAVDGMNA